MPSRTPTTPAPPVTLVRRPSTSQKPSNGLCEVRLAAAMTCKCTQCVLLLVHKVCGHRPKVKDGGEHGYSQLCPFIIRKAHSNVKLVCKDCSGNARTRRPSVSNTSNNLIRQRAPPSPTGGMCEVRLLRNLPTLNYTLIENHPQFCHERQKFVENDGREHPCEPHFLTEEAIRPLTTFTNRLRETLCRYGHRQASSSTRAFKSTTSTSTITSRYPTNTYLPAVAAIPSYGR